MKLRGSHPVEASRDVVWAALLDPEVIARTIPGVEGLKPIGEHAYEGALRLEVGPVRGAFQGTVRLSDLDPPSSYSLQLEGQGAPGFVRGQGTVRLEERAGATDVHYDFDLRVGGRLAAVGQRLVDSTARATARQALGSLERQVRERSASPVAGAGTVAQPGPAAPSQAKFAAGVAKQVLADVLPRRAGPWLVAGAVVVLVVLVAAGLRGCA